MSGAADRGVQQGLGPAVWVLVLGIFDFSLEQAIVIPALPAMGSEYGASLTSVAWVVTGFLVAAAVATPLAGRLGDQYGKRLVILVSLALFGIGSIACALGQGIGVVIAGRVVQGLGAGVGPLAVALARDLVPARSLPRAVGLLIGAGGLGGTIGFLVAGPLVDHVSVQSIFWLLAIVAAILAVGVACAVRESDVRSRVPIDWLGAVLLGGTLAALMLALSQGNEWGWGSARLIGLLAAGAVLLGALIGRELAAEQPLIDPAGLRQRPIWAAQATVFAVGVGLFVAYVLVPQITALPTTTGYGLGLTTTEGALVLLPGAIGALAGGVLGGWLVLAVGARAQSLAGVGLALLAYVMLVGFDRTTALLTVAMIPLGFGTGLVLSAITDLIVTTIRADQTGAGLGLNSVLRAVGAAIGAAAAAAILTGSEQLAPGVAVESSFTEAFALGLAATAVAFASLLLIPRRSADPVLAVSTEAPTADPDVDWEV